MLRSVAAQLTIEVKGACSRGARVRGKALRGLMGSDVSIRRSAQKQEAPSSGADTDSAHESPKNI